MPGFETFSSDEIEADLLKAAGEVIHWTDWYQQNRKPASDEQKRRMKGLLQRGYTHAEAADLVSCVYDDMGRLFQKPPKVIEGAEKKADTEDPEVRDYTFFGYYGLRRQSC